MAGSGLLTSADMGRILAGDSIIADDSILSSNNHGMNYKAPRLSILSQQPQGGEQQAKAVNGKRAFLDNLPIPNLEPGSTTSDIPFPASTGGAEDKYVSFTQTLAQGAVFVPKFVEAWCPWKNCGDVKGAESKAICSVMSGMGERGDDGMGGKAKFVFTPAPPQALREVEAEMGGQQRLMSHELAVGRNSHTSALNDFI